MSLSFLDQLQSRFSSDSITRADFRAYIGVSIATDWRMFNRGAYPRVIHVGNRCKIMLSDLAAWLEKGGSVDVPQKRRGRPVGSKNKSKIAHS